MKEECRKYDDVEIPVANANLGLMQLGCQYPESHSLNCCKWQYRQQMQPSQSKSQGNGDDGRMSGN